MSSAQRRYMAGLACLVLLGCGSSVDLKESLGLNREGPDEYRVVPRPPLSVPPEFNLRPPGAHDTDTLSGKPAEARAHDEVLGVADANTPPKPVADTAVTPVTSGNLASGSDAQFLSDAGGTKADPNIRQKLQGEKTVTASDPNYLFGGKKQGDTQVDPTKEAARIKTDQTENKPITTGDTPTVPPEDKGFLGNLFR